MKRLIFFVLFSSSCLLLMTSALENDKRASRAIGKDDKIGFDIDLQNSRSYHGNIHRKSEYEYGYKVKLGEQFQHQKRAGNVTFGCYGFVDPKIKSWEVFYVSDFHGYRTVRPPNSLTIYDDINDSVPVGERGHFVGKTKTWAELNFPGECTKAHELIKQFSGETDGAKAVAIPPTTPRAATTQRVTTTERTTTTEKATTTPKPTTTTRRTTLAPFTTTTRRVAVTTSAPKRCLLKYIDSRTSTKPVYLERTPSSKYVRKLPIGDSLSFDQNEVVYYGCSGDDNFGYSLDSDAVICDNGIFKYKVTKQVADLDNLECEGCTIVQGDQSLYKFGRKLLMDTSLTYAHNEIVYYGCHLADQGREYEKKNDIICDNGVFRDRETRGRADIRKLNCEDGIDGSNSETIETETVNRIGAVDQNVVTENLCGNRDLLNGIDNEAFWEKINDIIRRAIKDQASEALAAEKFASENGQMQGKFPCLCPEHINSPQVQCFCTHPQSFYSLPFTQQFNTYVTAKDGIKAASDTVALCKLGCQNRN